MGLQLPFTACNSPQLFSTYLDKSLIVGKKELENLKQSNREINEWLIGHYG